MIQNSLVARYTIPGVPAVNSGWLQDQSSAAASMALQDGVKGAPGSGSSVGRTSVMHKLMSAMHNGRLTHDMVVDGPKPLLTRYLLRGVPLPHINTSRLVLNGVLTQEEASSMDQWLGIDDSTLIRLNEVLPEEDFTRKYSTCAVVGNSPKLLTSQYGAQIDSHDAVLRFNDAPTKGFETYVGRRCTFRANNLRWTQLLLHRGAPMDGSVQQKQSGREKMYKPGAKTLLMFGTTPLNMYNEMRQKYPANIIYYVAPEVTHTAASMYRRVAERLESLGEGPFPPRGVRGGPRGTGVARGARADGEGVAEVPASTMPPGVECILFLMQVCNKVVVYGFEPSGAESTTTSGDVKGVGAPAQLYYERSSGNFAAMEDDVTPDKLTYLFLRILALEGHINLV